MEGHRQWWQRKKAHTRIWHAPYLRSYGLLLAALMLLRVYRLDAQSLWFDELSTWWLVSTTSWSDLFVALIRPQAGYPFYHLLLKCWIGIVGDSEWSLRALSATAGALTLPVLEAMARLLQIRPLAVSLLVGLSPFALWYGQEATAYSLLLLTAALVIWRTLRALETPSRVNSGWLLLTLIVCASTHRLGMFLVAGSLVAWLSGTQQHGPQAAMGKGAVATTWQLCAWLGCGLFCASIVGYSVYALNTQALPMTTSHRQASVIEALHMTLAHFAIGHDVGRLSRLWLLPIAILFCWGSWLTIAQWRAWPSRVLLVLLVVPLSLFCVQLAWTNVYEPRYMMLLYPAWIALVARPFSCSTPISPKQQVRTRASWATRVRYGLFGSSLLVNGAMLFLMPTGLWSGHPVREQHREAVAYLTQHIHPDNSLMVHPGYLALAWFYYAPRLSPDPLPHPLTFTTFAEQRTSPAILSDRLNETSRLRSLLFIGPFHAHVIDAAPPGQRYGVVGSFYEQGGEGWEPCPGARFLGIDILCLASPRNAARSGPLEPATPVTVPFGDVLVLRGYTLKPFAGRFHAGGELPITLFWENLRPSDERYHFVLTLRRSGASESGAVAYGPFLSGTDATFAAEGGHADERALPLRSDTTGDPLGPGRYELLLRVYAADQGPTTGLLRIHTQSGQQTSDYVLTTVDIDPPR